jgi:hypothetical protein
MWHHQRKYIPYGAIRLNSLIWAIGGFVLIYVWMAFSSGSVNVNDAWFHKLTYAYIPAGFLWIVGLVMLLDIARTPLPRPGIAALSIAWLVGITFTQLIDTKGYDSLNNLFLIAFHFLIVGWVELIALILVLSYFYNISFRLIHVTIAWVGAGILYSVFFLVGMFISSGNAPDFLNTLMFAMTVSCGAGIAGYIGGKAMVWSALVSSHDYFAEAKNKTDLL